MNDKTQAYTAASEQLRKAFPTAIAALREIAGDKEVTIGSDVSYAGFEEEGTSKRPPHPFLRPALEEHKAEYVKIIEEEINSANS